MKISIWLILTLALLAALMIAGCVNQMSATCFPTVKTSPEVPNHIHMWCLGQEYTKEYCNAEKVCHRHVINEAANIAEAPSINPHTHQLK